MSHSTDRSPGQARRRLSALLALLMAASLLAGVPAVAAEEMAPTATAAAGGPAVAAAPAAPTATVAVGGAAGCGPLDVAFAIDVTGSMSGALANVRAELSGILDGIEGASGGDYRLAEVHFDDGVTVVEPFAERNRGAIEPRLGRLGVESVGGNEPEASDEALNTIVNGLAAAGRRQRGDFTPGFRAGASRVVVLVTDARPGGFADAFVPGVNDVAALARAREARAAGIKLNAIFVPTGSDTTQHRTIREIMRRYASETGGRFVETRPNGRGTADAIREIVRACGVGASQDATSIDMSALLRDGGSTMNELLQSTGDIVQPILPYLLAATIVTAFLVGWVTSWSLIGANVLRRNPVMHVMNNGSLAFAAPFALVCAWMGMAAKTLIDLASQARERWTAWAVPARRTAEPNDRGVEPVAPGAWHGWEFLAWVPYFGLQVILLMADLAFLGLASTYLLGVPLYEQERKPVLFGLTWDAVAFALAVVVQVIIFLAVYFDIKGAAPGGARPWGNASVQFGKRIESVALAGATLSIVGGIALAVYRAELVIMNGDPTRAGWLIEILPYVFLPIFAVTIPVASALAFWSVTVGLAALGIMALMAFGLVIERLRIIPHVLHESIEALDEWVISWWDAVCKPMRSIWNNLLAGRRVFSRTLPRLTEAYCDRRSLRGQCAISAYAVLSTLRDRPACYCTPHPEPTPAAPTAGTSLALADAEQANAGEAPTGSDAAPAAAVPAGPETAPALAVGVPNGSVAPTPEVPVSAETTRALVVAQPTADGAFAHDHTNGRGLCG